MLNSGQFTMIDPVRNGGYEKRKGYAHPKTHFKAHHALFNCDCLCRGLPD
jgi:hypothetical protein